MALFESKESKELKKQMKRDEAAAAQQAKQLAKLTEYHLEGIDDEYRDSCVQIIDSLFGTGLIEFGSTLSGMKSEDKLKTAYLHAIMDQNWIMIRQLDQMNKNLQQLVDATSKS